MGVAATATECFPDQDGNYDSPVLRRLFQTWDEYDAGMLDERRVHEVLDRIEKLTLVQIKDMESEPEDPDDPDRMTILNAFHDHLEGLDLMRDSLADDDPELVDEALDLLQQATNQMMEGMLGLMGGPGPKLCLSCSCPNCREAKFCSTCNAILPVHEAVAGPQVISIQELEPEEEEPGLTTPNYAEMLQAYEDWLDGAHSNEGLLRVALTIRNRHLKEIEELHRAFRRPLKARLKDYIALRIPVIEQNRDAMSSLAAALEAGDEMAVEDGMDSLEAATLTLVELELAWRDRV